MLDIKKEQPLKKLEKNYIIESMLEEFVNDKEFLLNILQ